MVGWAPAPEPLKDQEDSRQQQRRFITDMEVRHAVLHELDCRSLQIHHEPVNISP